MSMSMKELLHILRQSVTYTYKSGLTENFGARARWQFEGLILNFSQKTIAKFNVDLFLLDILIQK